MSLVDACLQYAQTCNLAPIRRAVVGERGELADAARDILKGGRHAGECAWAPEGHCVIHVETWRGRRARLLGLLGIRED